MSTEFAPISLAGPATDAGAKRALILPGGGLRLSYQVGILQALQEAGLSFQIMDGTSGGGLNLSMLLSGLSPADMAQRWRSLKLQDTLAFLPLKDYLTSSPPAALADTSGFKNKVLPHLGIDFERIHAAPVQASYNLLDYGDKAIEVVQHTAIDADLLIAGMSLPGVFAPLHRNGKVYLDTGFVQDANLTEAVRQGAEELWVLWGLGNTGVYLGDPLHLYVQMLEMSANSALNQQLAAIRDLNVRIARGDSPHGQRRPVAVHIIKPDHPLPLDPDLYLGHIDHGTLIDMGYADAKKYLAQQQTAPAGASEIDLANPTRMVDPVPGIRLRLQFCGALTRQDGGGAQPATLQLCLHVHDLAQYIAAAQRRAPFTGHLQTAAWASGPVPLHGGQYVQTVLPDGARRMTYQSALQNGSKTLTLCAEQLLRNDAGLDLWKDLSTLSLRLLDGQTLWASGDLTLSLPDLKSWLASLHATETRSAAEAAATVARYGRFFLGELHSVYGWLG